MSIFRGLWNIYTQDIYIELFSDALLLLQYYLPSGLEYESVSTFSHFHVCSYVLHVSILWTTMIYFHNPSKILSCGGLQYCNFCYKFSFNTLYYIILVIVKPRRVIFKFIRQKRSTEGCSKFKSPETRQVQERLVSNIRTHASPKVGQDQVSGGVSVLCWHAAPVAYVLWKPCTIR